MWDQIGQLISIGVDHVANDCVIVTLPVCARVDLRIY